MKPVIVLKIIALSVFCALSGTEYAKARDSIAFEEMPNSCRNMPLEMFSFELPLPTQHMTIVQKEKIHAILNESRMQACILQMQYDGLLQQVIAMIFENKDVSNEQLQPYYNRLLPLIKNKIENKVQAVIVIRKIMSEKEWQGLVTTYKHEAAIKNNFMKQQMNFWQSYENLITDNRSNELTIQSLLPSFSCAKNNSKMMMLEQMILKLALTGNQVVKIRNIVQQQESQSCVARQDLTRYAGQLFEHLINYSDQIETKSYQSHLNQLVSKEYLLETYSLQMLISLFQILTDEQKIQLREKYMIMKGIF